MRKPDKQTVATAPSSASSADAARVQQVAGTGESELEEYQHWRATPVGAGYCRMCQCPVGKDSVKIYDDEFHFLCANLIMEDDDDPMYQVVIAPRSNKRASAAGASSSSGSGYVGAVRQSGQSAKVNDDYSLRPG